VDAHQVAAEYAAHPQRPINANWRQETVNNHRNLQLLRRQLKRFFTLGQPQLAKLGLARSQA